MQPENSTLLSLLLEILSLTIMVPLLMGKGVSRAARLAQLYLALQAMGWVALWQHEQPYALQLRWLTGPLGVLAHSASLSVLWLALQCWLGRRPGRLLMLILPFFLATLAGWQDMAPEHWGTDFAGIGLAAQMGLLMLACLLPRRAVADGAQALEPIARKDLAWRGLLALGFASLGALIVVRSSLHWFVAHSPWEPVLTNWVLLCSHVVLQTSLISIMVAWRGETEEQLQRLALTDELSGLANRRAFGKRAEELIALARRHGEPLSLVMLDLDFFKQVNDQHGHDGGDRALALFASCVQQVLRVGDLAGRIGGEEFCVLLARSDEQGPPAMDARLRAVLLSRAEKELGFALDFSGGWALLRAGDRSVEDMMRRADAALYEAKRSGRGRLCNEPGWPPAEQTS